MKAPEKIASFSVNHDVIEPGIYVSRIDGDVTTYDMRTRKPNGGDYMDNLTMHSVEHMFATYIRSSEIGASVLYFGPMGCRTGFYLLVRNADNAEFVKTVIKTLLRIVNHSGEMFGASREECGNYENLSLDAAKKTIAEVFSNDADAYAEAYFEALATYGCENPKIIGPFDLVTKYNEIEPIVNTASPRYIAAWQKAADALLRSGAYFEINTGAVSCGYRKTPYPSGEILTYLKDRGAKFVLSGDAHRKENLAFHFEEAARYANSFGIFEFCQDIVENSQK